MQPEKRIQTEQLPDDFDISAIYLVFGRSVFELRKSGPVYVGWLHPDSIREQMHEAGLDDDGVASCMAVIQDDVDKIDPWVEDDSSIMQTTTIDIGG